MLHTASEVLGLNCQEYSFSYKRYGSKNWFGEGHIKQHNKHAHSNCHPHLGALLSCQSTVLLSSIFSVDDPRCSGLPGGSMDPKNFA